MRSLLADYGVPLMVLVWTGASYALQSATPAGIPRRLALPNPWDEAGRANFEALTQLGAVSGTEIAYALVPALIITLLFYFDHNVSSQLAQQKDFQLVRPPAYHWDLLVLAALTVRPCRHLLHADRVPVYYWPVRSCAGLPAVPYLAWYSAICVSCGNCGVTIEIKVWHLRFDGRWEGRGLLWVRAGDNRRNRRAASEWCAAAGAHAHQVAGHAEADAH